jgi:hypothetical protein
MNESWVWLKDPQLPPRAVVRIKSQSTGKSVHCEALQIDENFIAEYNNSPRSFIRDSNDVIVLSQWYRARLGGIQPGEDHDLEVIHVGSAMGQLRACLGHPQQVVRLATWLGLLSVALGAVGVVLALL